MIATMPNKTMGFPLPVVESQNNIIGADRRLLGISNAVRIVAPADASVLIQGERRYSAISATNAAPLPGASMRTRAVFNWRMKGRCFST
jgi:hypothetical protein